jgi:hypothetical protein|tara:strand:- start:2940 stop:3551 length:612 start_codon:yes stop_codon:yes gene_type:complete
MLDYVALQRTIMYSYSVNIYDEHLDELVTLAKSGDITAAREGLRTFTKKHPHKLLAWKFLADLASSAKERSDAIRRAQLLAPGDPWVIEAKKQSKPPGYKPENYSKINNSAALESQNIDNGELIEAIEAPTETNTIANQNSTAAQDQPSSESIHSSNLDTYVQKEQLTIKTSQKSEQPGWLIWVASIMGIAGLVLLYVAWSMS